MREHVNLYSKSNPNARTEIEDITVVDLFPYKIKDRNLFYHRDHPKDVHPDSMTYEKHWLGEFLQSCIEGKWIQDKNGTWVFMMPKLFFYINYVVILNKKRKKIQPDLCDLEWIYFTYFLCLDGFSGFEGDKDYTCNELVDRYNKSKDTSLTEKEREMHALNEIEFANIPKNCYKEDGTFKEYINAWDYLTRFYLIDNPRGPLGRPIYDNPRRNGFILGARGIRKSFSVYMGDFMHEWTFSGVRYMEDIGDTSNPLLFAMGCGSSQQLERTLKNVRGFYDSQPGKFRFEGERGEDPFYDMGPYYKNYQGRLGVGKEFQHIVKETSGTVDTFGSTVQASVITPDRTKIAAGDRFRRIYIEEVGFLEEVEEVYIANSDSINVEGESVGSWIATGTGGDIKKIMGSKKMFEKPHSYDIFGVPYYWKNPDKYIGLFIPAQYSKRQFDDGNGFIYLDLATKEIIKQRDKWYRDLDSVAAGNKIMFNPVIPDEMLIPNELSIFPKKEAQQRLSDIESYDIDKKVGNIGELVEDHSYPHGIRFDKDMRRKLSPIDRYDVDFSSINREGAFLMYEPPPSGEVPKFMYWVVYDPAAKSGEGTSLHSVIVYKHFLSSDGNNMRDAIVAEWIGRYTTLEDNYEMVIKIARFYNAKVFPEINIAGFLHWCKAKGRAYTSMLQRDSYDLQKEITPTAKRSHYRAGFQMNDRMKWWATQRFSEWLMEVKTVDPESGFVLTRNIDYIYSKRLLEEIIYYKECNGPECNFDHISSCRGLMILLTQLETYKPDNLDIEDEDDWDEPIVHKPKVLTRRRSKFENFMI